MLDAAERLLGVEHVNWSVGSRPIWINYTQVMIFIGPNTTRSVDIHAPPERQVAVTAGQEQCLLWPIYDGWPLHDSLFAQSAEVAIWPAPYDASTQSHSLAVVRDCIAQPRRKPRDGRRRPLAGFYHHCIENGSGRRHLGLDSEAKFPNRSGFIDLNLSGNSKSEEIARVLIFGMFAQPDMMSPASALPRSTPCWRPDRGQEHARLVARDYRARKVCRNGRRRFERQLRGGRSSRHTSCSSLSTQKYLRATGTECLIRPIPACRVKSEGQ